MESKLKFISTVVLAITVLAFAAIGCGGDEVKSTKEIAKENHPATLLVVGKAQGLDAATLSQGGVLYGCSGWVYDAEEQLVVTNAHCVSAPKILAGPSNTQLTGASVVAVNNRDDIAVLRVPGLPNDVTEIPLADSVEQGEDVFVLGYPGNGKPDQLQTPYQIQEGTVTAVKGVQSQVGYDGFTALWDELEIVNDNSGITLRDLIQTSASTTHGGSGGPVLNDKGELIGMTVSGSAEGNQNDTVGLKVLKKALPKMIKGESVSYLGVSLSAVPTDFADFYESDGFLLVGNITPNSPVDQQTDQRVLLQKVTKANGFIAVTTINGHTVTTQQELTDTLENVQSGEQVTLREFAIFLDGSVEDIGKIVFTAP